MRKRGQNDTFCFFFSSWEDNCPNANIIVVNVIINLRKISELRFMSKYYIQVKKYIPL